MWRWAMAGLLVLSAACGGDGASGTTEDSKGADSAGDDTAETGDGEVGDAVVSCEGGYAYAGHYMLPGPCEAGFDAELAAKAERYERSFHLFSAAATGANTDVSVALESEADRTAMEDFLREEEGWDFEGFAGKTPMEVITRHHKVAGLYGGVGIAADAYRYGVLRDQGYPAAEVEIAREHVVSGFEAFHRAVAITGTPGVIARGYARKDLPGDGQIDTVPLFDAGGNPLPEPKNNGTWRDDLSGGLYPNYIWEDSISRDQMLGWVTAAAAIWEVARDDPSFDQSLKDTLQADALAVSSELMVVRESGYDLEFPDADGRTTFHGYINEHCLDSQIYIPTIENGFHALMALGFVAAWVYVTDDPALRSYLYDELLGERELARISRDSLYLVDMGLVSSYSAYNMAFGSAWLALRYIEDPATLATLRQALEVGLYAVPDKERQPIHLGQSYFDFIYAAGMAGENARGPASVAPVDEAAMARGVATLHGFHEPPYWSYGRVNCPEAVCDCEDTPVDSADCTALDGSHLTVLGCVGRKCDLITDELVPISVRGPSNYEWRSNPFEPNRGGDGSSLMPGVDFRIAYWTARWTRIAK